MGMSERGCADVCGRNECKGKGGNRWGEGPVGMSERGCADVCGQHRCADMCGQCGHKAKVEMAGEKDGWACASVDVRTCADTVDAKERWKWKGRRTSGHERVWMRGRVRTVWRVQGKGWKWVGRRTGGYE